MIKMFHVVLWHAFHIIHQTYVTWESICICTTFLGVFAEANMMLHSQNWTQQTGQMGRWAERPTTFLDVFWGFLLLHSQDWTHHLLGKCRKPLGHAKVFHVTKTTFTFMSLNRISKSHLFSKQDLFWSILQKIIFLEFSEKIGRRERRCTIYQKWCENFQK